MRLEWGQGTDRRNELGFGKAPSQEQRLAYKAVPPDDLDQRAKNQAKHKYQTKEQRSEMS